MTPVELKNYLSGLVRHGLKMSVMMWGPAGIGKSSCVAQITRENNFDLVDLRLSQLAPTDLRGLPVPENGLSKWFPPEFLPREGKGVLFLDELNMAPPTLQGIAQQLILDRKVGSYTVPEGWYIWAAGNRKEDRASVFDMPAPLANRFLHLEVLPDFESFRVYALERGMSEQVLAFLSYRPTLLHKIDPQRPAWPSPRCYDATTEVLTRRGFIPWPEVTSEDEFATLDPQGKMSFAKPVEMVAAPYKGKMYHFSAGHLDLLITPEHKMYCAPDRMGGDVQSLRRRNKEEFGLVSAEVLVEQLRQHKTWAVRFRSDASWDGAPGRPAAKKLGDREVSWEIWAEFLGWWLTDGYLRMGNKGTNHHVVITQVSEEGRARIAWLFAKLGCGKAWICKDRVVAHDVDIYKELQPLGKKHNTRDRFVPRDVMDQGRDVLRALLAGAFGGDGWDSKGTRYICVGRCIRLAADLQEAAIKSGGSARVSTRTSRAGSTLHTVTLMGHRYSRPRVSHSNVQEEDYDGLVYCCRVDPHHTLLVRRNGHAIWSGNSWEMGSRLYEAGLDLTPAVGEGTAAEFFAFTSLYKNLPDLEAVLAGKGQKVKFPDEPSVRYATVVGLSMRPKAIGEAIHAFLWLVGGAGAEWVQLFVNNLMVQVRMKSWQGQLAMEVQKHPELRKFIADYQKLLGFTQ